MAQLAYWVILAGSTPTAFRASTREVLVPTLRQLQRTQPDVTLRWFERGRLWESPEAARFGLREQPPREPRGEGWRPGGNHRAPRAKYELTRDQKRARFKDRARRTRETPRPEGGPTDAPPHDTPPRDTPPQDRPQRPWTPARPPKKPWSRDRPGGGFGHRPKGGGFGKRPFKPFGGPTRDGDRPRDDRPAGDRPPGGERKRPFTPRGERPGGGFGDRPKGGGFGKRPFKPFGGGRPKGGGFGRPPGNRRGPGGGRGPNRGGSGGGSR